MSGGEVRKVSRQDIQLVRKNNYYIFVQNLIERCLQLYMNQKEVVETLSYQAKIEPSFTELVWQKLEEENREFFKAYYVRLMLKNQIVFFNQLLQDQYSLMSKEHTSALTSTLVSNGSNPSTLNQHNWDLPCATAGMIANSMICNGGSGSSTGALMNGTSSQLIHTDKQVQCLNPNPGSMNPPQNLTASTGRFNGGVNGAGPVVKTETSFGSDVGFGFGDPSFSEPCPSMGDASGGSFSSSELTGQPLADSILDIDSSFGFLSQIPRNFSFSDLTEDFSQSAEILENYGRSPFLPTDANNFSDSTGDGGNRRLDTISEGATYEDFASD